MNCANGDDRIQQIMIIRGEEVVTVAMQMPEKTGNYPVKVPISSDQGDLGTHNLEIIVT